jgi:hypothetical protein
VVRILKGREADAARVQQAPHAERYPRVVALHVHLCVPDCADALSLREAVKGQRAQLAAAPSQGFVVGNRPQVSALDPTVLRCAYCGVAVAIAQCNVMRVQRGAAASKGAQLE